MSIVVLEKCNGYADETVLSALRSVFRQLDAMSELLTPGCRVLMKPNLLDHLRGPDSAINTHPALLKALAYILINDFGCRVSIGESSGGVSYGKTAQAFENTGILDFASELGVELIDFDRGDFDTVHLKRSPQFRSFQISARLHEFDCLIDVPKLKTHDLMDYTGAVKNMFGVIPGSGKRDVHMLAPRREELAECVVDIFAAVKPRLCIMDAVVAMEGAGPAGGDPRAVNLLMASRDAVALDAVAQHIIGFEPESILTTSIAAGRGLGESCLQKIEIRGPELNTLRIKDFKMSPRLNFARRRFIPDFAVRVLWQGQTGGLPVIAQDRCKRCGICLRSCPVKAIETDKDGSLHVRAHKCIECYCCRELCPHNALDLRYPLPVRIFDFLVMAVSKILRLKGSFSYQTRGRQD